MPVKILIIVDHLRLEAELFDTPCGRAVAATLPVRCRESAYVAAPTVTSEIRIQRFAAATGPSARHTGAMISDGRGSPVIP